MWALMLIHRYQNTDEFPRLISGNIIWCNIPITMHLCRVHFLFDLILYDPSTIRHGAN